MKKVKEKITKRVFDCIDDIGKNLMSYFNIVLTMLPLNIFLTFKTNVDFNSDRLRILNYDGVLSLHREAILEMFHLDVDVYV